MLARRGIQPVNKQTVIEEGGTAGDKPEHIKLHKHASLQGGYAHIWGSDVIQNQVAAATRSRKGLDFGYIQLVVSY